MNRLQFIISFIIICITSWLIGIIGVYFNMEYNSILLTSLIITLSATSYISYYRFKDIFPSKSGWLGVLLVNIPFISYVTFIAGMIIPANYFDKKDKGSVLYDPTIIT